MRLVAFISLLMMVLTAGCAYRGGGDDPGVRKFTLFSMLNGDDIRGKCTTASAYEHYRLFYNGVYEEQTRVYELVRGPRDGNVLKVSVSNPANVADFDAGDLLKPWRPVAVETYLKDAQFDSLLDSLGQAGFFSGAPKGLTVTSNSFWWMAVGCRKGQVYFHAWRHPTPDLMGLAFVKPLLALDTTGVKVNLPREPVSNMPPMQISPGVYDENHFDLKVGDNGLFGISSLF